MIIYQTFSRPLSVPCRNALLLLSVVYLFGKSNGLVVRPSCTSERFHQLHRNAASTTQFKTEPVKNQIHGELNWLKPSVASLLLSVSLMATPVPSALAITSSSSFDPSVYTNDYSDPFHPQCKRHIEVSIDKKTFHYSGTAVGPKDDPVRRGCSPDEIRKYKLRKGEFDGIILDNGRISAGDGIHEGVWEPANTATTNIGYEDVDGIRWNDGNKWIVQSKSLAMKSFELFFLTYIGVSTLAGLNELVKRAKNLSQ